MKAAAEKRIHQVFEASILAKGAFAIGEILGGLALALVGVGTIYRLAALVSRSSDLDPPLIVSAAVESLAENLTDSVVAPLLFFAALGLPGALAYRAVNTMEPSGKAENSATKLGKNF